MKRTMDCYPVYLSVFCHAILFPTDSGKHFYHSCHKILPSVSTHLKNAQAELTTLAVHLFFSYLYKEWDCQVLNIRFKPGSLD